MTASDIALLVLENGIVFKSRAWGVKGRTLGEVVLSTDMTDYQETLTNPSYHRQIVVMTASHIGNASVDNEDPEFSHIWVVGLVVRDVTRHASNWRSCRKLEGELISQDIVGIADIDTRVITCHTREWGTIRTDILSGDALSAGAQYLGDEAMASLVRIVTESPAAGGAALVAEVSTDETCVAESLGDFEGREPIVCIIAADLDIKSHTPYHLATCGARTYVAPSTVSFTDTEALKPDGISFSNGPGDSSTADRKIGVLHVVLDMGIPYFGICFGHQFFSRALGHGTYRLDYGHHGINRPVKEVATGRVGITAHNHGFMMDAPVGEPSVAPFESGRYGRIEVSHVGLDDSAVEGLCTLDIPAFSVQYHPEATAGPHDGELLLDCFISLMTAAKETH